MPLFNDLKKIFFGAKSVAKHQGQKAADEISDASDELLDATKDAARQVIDKAPDYAKKGKEALDDLTDKIFRDADFSGDKGSEVSEDGLDLSDLKPTPEHDAPKSGSIDYESDLVEDPGMELKEPSAFKEATNSGLDAAARAGLAAKDKAEDLAEKASELGNDLLGKAATVGAGLKDKADSFIDHASKEADKMKLEDSIEEAKVAAAQAEARARAFDGKEGERDTSESNLDGMGSFFERADRFAKGDYTNEGGKDMRIIEDAVPKEKKPEGGQIAGFLDSDNDGDSLIDDAQIIEEE